MFKWSRVLTVSDFCKQSSSAGITDDRFFGGFQEVCWVGSIDWGNCSNSLAWFVGIGIKDHFILHFSLRMMYFSSKWSSHKTDCFVGFQFWRFTNQIHNLFSSVFFNRKQNFAICLFSFFAYPDLQEGAAHLFTIAKIDRKKF